MLTNYSFSAPYNAWSYGGAVQWTYSYNDDVYWVRRRHHANGIRLSYQHIPDGIAGDRIGLAAVIEAPFSSWFGYSISFGLSYYTRSRNVTGDQDNMFIATAISALIDLGLVFRPVENAFVDLRLVHSSTGMLSFPNRGLNFFQLGAGVDIQNSGARPIEVRWREVSDVGHEVGFTISPAVATTSRFWEQTGYYPCYDISLNYQYYLDPAVGVGGTVDLWFPGHHWERIERGDARWPVPMYWSTLFFIEGFWGPVSIKAGIGPVLLASELVDIWVYERLGIYYNVGSCYLGIGINAHAGQAEFIEWSFGRRFRVG